MPVDVTDVAMSRDSGIDLQNFMFSFRTGEVRIEWEIKDVSDSDSGKFTQSRRGRGTMFINIEATVLASDNPHAAPLSIAVSETEFIRAQVWPVRTSDDEDSYRAPTFIVSQFTFMGNAGDGGAGVYRIVGQSTGVFYVLGETEA